MHQELDRFGPRQPASPGKVAVPRDDAAGPATKRVPKAASPLEVGGMAMSLSVSTSFHEECFSAGTEMHGESDSRAEPLACRDIEVAAPKR